MKAHIKTFAIYLLIGILIITGLSFTSASKVYDPDTNEYRTYDYFFFKKYDIRLGGVEDSIINARAYGTVNIHKETKVFKKLYYFDEWGNKKDFKEGAYKIYVNQSYQSYKYIPNITCEDIGINDLGYMDQNCTDNGGHWVNDTLKTNWVEVDYNEKLPEGYYLWKIEARKPKNKVIDFIIVTDDEGDLLEWAWWDASWLYKQAINVTENTATTLNNYSVRMNVTYNANMQNDFDDLRFINSTEDGELDYWIEDKQDGVYAIVWVFFDNITASFDDTIAYMYYGNGAVSSTSNITNAFIYGNAGDVNDLVTFKAACTASTSDGVINVNNSVQSACKIDLPLAYTSGVYQVNMEEKIDNGVCGGGLGDDGGGDWRGQSTHSQVVVASNFISSWEGAGQSTWGWYAGGFGNFTANVTIADVSTTDGVNMSMGVSNGTTFAYDRGMNDGNNFNSLDHIRIIFATGGDMQLRNIWFRPLAGTEPTVTFGAEQADNLPPNVTLQAPANDTTVNTNGYTATYYALTIDYDGTLQNCTITFWNLSTGLVQYTGNNLTVTNNTNTTFEQTIGASNYTWGVSCIDDGGATGTSGNRTINVIPIADDPPVVTLQAPANETMLTTSPVSVDFSCISSDDQNLINTSLVINGAVNQTDSSGINNSNYSFTTSLSDGSYTWTCRAFDNSSQSTTPTARNIYVDSVAPEINLSANVSLIDTFNESINYSYNFSDLNPSVCIFEFNGANETVTCADGFITKQYPTSNPATVTARFYANDTFGKNNVSSFVVSKNATAPKINITAPGDQAKIDNGDDLSVNYSITGNVTTLSVCILEYAGSNSTLDCLEGNYTFTYSGGVNTLRIYANDTLNNMNSTTRSWVVDLSENSQTFPNSTSEGSTETFLANVTLRTGVTIQSVLFYYNGTSYTGEVFASGPDFIARIPNFIIPNVDAEVNVTFYWNLSLSTGANAILNSYNVTVTPLLIDECGVYTNEILSFRNVQEKEQTLIGNSTIEYAVNIFSSDESLNLLNLSNSTTDNPVSICLNVNITGTTNYILDTIVKYTGTDGNDSFAIEYYNIDGFTLNNESVLQNITLYDLNTNNATQFKVTFTGSDFVAVENALIFVNRQYIDENVFKTVELPKTDSNGQTIVNLVRNTQIYNFVVTLNGEVIGTFNNLVAFCDDFTIGDCQINLNAETTGEEIYNNSEALGITFTNPVYNNATRLVSFNFVSADGTNKQVFMNVTRNDVFGNRSVCTSIVNSTGGTLSCIVPANIDDTSLITKIFVNSVQVAQNTVTLVEIGFGVFGFVVLFIWVLSIALMFTTDRTLLLIGVTVGVLSGVGLGLIGGGVIGGGAVGVSLIVATVLMIWKINKEKVD